MSTGSVGIIGGGLIGLATAYRLAQAGVDVSVYERDAQLGGLAGTAHLDGIPVDRYYHVVLPTDDRVRGLAAEVGLGDEAFRFRTTRVGFYQQGRLTSMSSARELLTFPGLSAVDRVRLAAFAARCQLKPAYADLDDLSLEEWLRRVCGADLWDRLWRPLLDSKFDGRYDDLPATYLWARTRRMSATRDRAAREVMGTIEGGYQVLIDALAREIRALGGQVHTSTPVLQVPAAGGRALGVVLADGLRRHDWVVTTQLRPALQALLAPELEAVLGPDPNRYLGVVCVVARLRRSISPYYALNITDRRIPLTTVVETTHVIDPQRAGGTLLYVPKYVAPDNPDLERSAADVRREYLGHVRTMFPQLRDADVLATHVARASVAEPIHVLGARRPQPADLFPAAGLATASSAHIYPELVNGQAVLGVAEQLTAGLLERVGGHGARERAA
ncbi:FAD-dependent oxidoreductase [Baekduia soli]|uniref:FAD-dependent oxidoreductase n=1 Tax=Baekduia soli TaxID=496014 RepID=A0A5B8UAP5_9ACTN|nr:FAD-dependent oxidoreductase [Baekduia soli]QEC50097.1 FAD-dependent oxidoreductase [Baekduia soli]